MEMCSAASFAASNSKVDFVQNVFSAKAHALKQGLLVAQ
jgi:hypothetical protein